MMRRPYKRGGAWSTSDVYSLRQQMLKTYADLIFAIKDASILSTPVQEVAIGYLFVVINEQRLE